MSKVKQLPMPAHAVKRVAYISADHLSERTTVSLLGLLDSPMDREHLESWLIVSPSVVTVDLAAIRAGRVSAETLAAVFDAEFQPNIDALLTTDLDAVAFSHSYAAVPGLGVFEW